MNENQKYFIINNSLPIFLINKYNIGKRIYKAYLSKIIDLLITIHKFEQLSSKYESMLCRCWFQVDIFFFSITKDIFWYMLVRSKDSIRYTFL